MGIVMGQDMEEEARNISYYFSDQSLNRLTRN